MRTEGAAVVWDVVIVGAGLAGLCCARRLQHVGHRVLVLEKSRGLGGRLATRRVGDQPIDHGCRFLKPTSPLMVQLIKQLQERQVLLPWHPICYDIADDGRLEVQSPDDCFVAPHGMTAVAKELVEGLNIRRQTQVVGLQYEDVLEASSKQVWTLRIETPVALTYEPLQSRAVILAVPAPQALALLQPIQSQISSAFIQSLKQVVFNPIISVMSAYETAPLPANLTKEKQGWSINGNANTPFTWLGLDSSKRNQSAYSTIVIHSSTQFAESYLQANDLNSAGQDLLKRSSEFLNINLMKPSWTQTHRWRYAEPITVLGGELMSEVPLPLACCGDWCRGADAGAAMESGWQIAGKIHGYLKSGTANSAISDELF
ncbi:MAG TPA: FAD-dependent oxidoreductase [Leptolyngbyaceae cyanobacterium]